MMNAGQMAALAAARVRDPGFEATTQANVISLISFSQQIVNGVLGDVVEQIPLQLQPRTAIYSISGFLPSAIKIMAVRDASGRDIDPLFGGVVDLANIDLRWPVAVSDGPPLSFAPVGRDLLCFHPSVITGQTVTIIASELIGTLQTANDETSVPDEDDHAILDLAEILMLLKNRDMQAAPEAIKRFEGRLTELKGEER